MIIIKPVVSEEGQVNQSNPGFSQVIKGKSYHGEQTGGKPSAPEKKKEDRSSNRNKSVK